jgi:hypothetical protein
VEDEIEDSVVEEAAQCDSDSDGPCYKPGQANDFHNQPKVPE